MGRDTRIAAAAVAAVLGAVCGPAVAQDFTDLPIDTPTSAGGVPVACTGVGQTKHDPQWQSYSVRVEFSNALKEYLDGGQISVSAHGKRLLSVRCDAPWILLKLPAGDYVVEGTPLNSSAKPRSAPFKPPAKGQMRLVLQFPDA